MRRAALNNYVLISSLSSMLVEVIRIGISLSEDAFFHDIISFPLSSDRVLSPSCQDLFFANLLKRC